MSHIFMDDRVMDLKHDSQQDIWSTRLAQSTFDFFSSAHHSALNSHPSWTIEIESRLGTKLDGRYVPGVRKSMFDGIRKHFVHTPPTETFDVVLSEGVRVSVDGKGEKVLGCLRKIKDPVVFPPCDVRVVGMNGEFDLRVAMNVEAKVEECEREEELALNWVRRFLKEANMQIVVSSRPRAEQLLAIKAGGVCKVTTRDLAKISHIDSEQILQDASYLSLAWVLSAPSSLKSLDDKGIVDFGMTAELTDETIVTIGNLPSGKHSIFQYRLHIQAKDLTWLETSTAGGAGDDDLIIPGDVFVRYKKRWSGPAKRSSSVLDMTQTTEGTTFSELRTCQPTYEIEIERAFLAKPEILHAIDAVAETEEFLRTTADIFYSIKNLRPVTDEVKVDWLGRDRKTIAGLMDSDIVDVQSLIGRKRPRVSSIVSAPLSLISVTADGDKKRIATDHYNQLNRDLSTRHNSWIFHLRCLNNFAKARLLTKYTPSPLNVLELACGKGADFNKLYQAAHRKMPVYVGTDIAQQSLVEHLSRSKQLVASSAVEYMVVCADLSNCDLSQENWDVSGSELSRWSTFDSEWKSAVPVLGPEITFNLISMQFALHYMFSSKQACERFFRGVAARMDVGARFVATTIDSDAMMSALLASPLPDKIELRDKHNRLTCVIKFETESLNRMFAEKIVDEDDPKNWYGLEYRFQLFDGNSVDQDSAVDAPEWLVVNDALVDLAAKFGLEIIEKRRLGEFAAIELETGGVEAENLYKRMHVPNLWGEVSPIEWRICNLYQVLVFRKLPPKEALDPFEEEKEFQSRAADWNSVSEHEQISRVIAALDAKEAGVA